MISVTRLSGLSRSAATVLAVLLVHGLALWGLQSGLIRRVAEAVIPVHLLADMVEPPRPAPAPLPPPQAPRPLPVRLVAPLPKAPAPPPPPQLIANPHPQPAPDAPTAVVATAAPLPPIASAVAAVAPLAAAPAEPPRPAPPRIELPNSDADYLKNAKPAYPPLSKRLNEQGTVLVRVLIGADGTAQTAEVQQSSGFFRLDEAAVATVLKWRYVPGKRAGQAETMWFTVPIAWVLR